MSVADLGLLDQLYAAYLFGQLLLLFGFTAWFVLCLERIRAANGSLDLYWNYVCRLLPVQIALYLLWYCADFILQRVVAG